METELVMPNLNLAREITNNYFNNSKPYLYEDAFYMFSISKFILLKERILKKDSSNNILYFDTEKNKSYIPKILEFYKYIKKNGTYKKNNTIVKLTNENYRTKELEEALWCFNKIRDSLAHGHYCFNFKRRSIIIYNEQLEKGFSLKCEIPIKLLNSFTLMVEENLEKNKIYDYKESTKELNNYKKYNKYDNIIINKYKEDNIYNNEIDYFINKEIKNISLDELCNLANLLLLVRPKNLKENKEILRLLKQYKELIVSYTEKNNNEDFNHNTQKLIKEMQRIIGIKSEVENVNGIISLYNYMSLVFSHSKEIDYSKLSLHSIHYKFIEDEEKEKKSNNEELIESIKRKCIYFNSNVNKHIKNYKTNSNQNFRHSLMDIFAKFYTETMEVVGSKNKLVISSIRNAIEHGNYKYYKKGYVAMYDQTNQNNDETIKFISLVHPTELFKITKQIESGGKKSFTIKDFLEQLSQIVGNNLFEETLNNLNEMSKIIFGKELDITYTMENMYHEALANVISNIAKK